jgi:hypothetical protein
MFVYLMLQAPVYKPFGLIRRVASRCPLNPEGSAGLNWLPVNETGHQYLLFILCFY